MKVESWMFESRGWVNFFCEICGLWRKWTCVDREER